MDPWLDLGQLRIVGDDLKDNKAKIEQQANALHNSIEVARAETLQDTPTLVILMRRDSADLGSAVFAPASASFSTPIICSSENLVRFVVCPSFEARL